VAPEVSAGPDASIAAFLWVLFCLFLSDFPVTAPALGLAAGKGF